MVICQRKKGVTMSGLHIKYVSKQSLKKRRSAKIFKAIKKQITHAKKKQ